MSSAINESNIEYGKGITYIVISGAILSASLLKAYSSKSLKIFQYVTYETAVALVVAFIAIELLTGAAVSLDEINNNNNLESQEVSVIRAGNIMYAFALGLGAIAAISTLVYGGTNETLSTLRSTMLFGKKRMKRRR